MLARIIFDIDSTLRQQNSSKSSLNILKSFTTELEDIFAILLHPEPIKCQTAARIIIFIGE